MHALDAGDEFEQLIARAESMAMSPELFLLLQRGFFLILDMSAGPEQQRAMARLHRLMLDSMAPRLIEAAQAVREPALRLEVFRRTSLYLWQVLEMPVPGAEADALRDRWRVVLEGLRLSEGAPQA